jgi:hypothetical protein
MMRKAPAERYARPAEVVAALAPFASGPAPVGRLVSAATDRPAADSATLEVAVPAEWFDFDPGSNEVAESPSVGPAAGPPLQQVFPRIDLEPASPPTASPRAGSPADHGRGWARSWLVVAAGVFLVTTIAAIVLALLKSPAVSGPGRRPSPVIGAQAHPARPAPE